MHRIRHFKIGGRTVWDRTKKLDVLTGSEQQEVILNGTESGFSVFYVLIIHTVT